jgi:predicted RNA-binding Zn-ribbon protein involved in translation (DUF1610 family)
MRDYGGDIPCPTCGALYHVSPRVLQGDLQIVFTCPSCGTDVVHDNDVAREIAEHFATIRINLSRLKI